MGILENVHLPEVLIKPFRNPNLGHFAIAALLYKLVSPARYLTTVTLTVPVVKALVRRGKIKTAGRYRQMLKDRIQEKRKQ